MGGLALNWAWRAYIAAGQPGLKIYDLSSPANPVLTNTVKTVGTAYSVTVQGHYAYLGDFPATMDIVALTAP